jgi:hypothetical protein
VKLAAKRRDWRVDSRVSRLAADTFWTSRLIPDFSQIVTPLLSAANWGGQGLHLRGNIEGFLNARSPQKWLDLHVFEHWTEFYTRQGIALQKRFFGHFLKEEDNGWGEEPRVQMVVRHPGNRHEELCCRGADNVKFFRKRRSYERDPIRKRLKADPHHITAGPAAKAAIAAGGLGTGRRPRSRTTAPS